MSTPNRYQEALKKVSSTKKEDGYMCIEINGDNKLVFPYKEGLVVMETLNKAETFKKYSSYVIEPLNQNYITVTLISNEEYKNMRVANLLNIPYYELQEALRKGVEV